MDLRTYIGSRSGKRSDVVADLAGRLEISAVYLTQLCAAGGAKAKREPAPHLAVSIEWETKGAVRRWDSRPRDWWLIWPEIIGVPGAPAIPATPEISAPADQRSGKDRRSGGDRRRGKRRSTDPGGTS